MELKLSRKISFNKQSDIWALPDFNLFTKDKISDIVISLSSSSLNDSIVLKSCWLQNSSASSFSQVKISFPKVKKKINNSSAEISYF